MSSDTCIVFICQSGELELKALLLAASLRKHLKQKNVELIAAVPEPDIWGDISPNTRQLLAKLKVKEQVISSPFKQEYPIGNKIAAMGVNTKASCTLFLDSDILCIDTFDIAALQTKGMKAKPADLATFCESDTEWQSVYGMFELNAPNFKVLSTVSKLPMLPYFNAGVVCVKDGAKFASRWLSIAKKVDDNEQITNKRPWLDQISLPVTTVSLDYPFELTSEAFNYPAHLKSLPKNNDVVLCHYHSPDVIFEEGKLSQLVGELCDQHSELKSAIQAREKWASILRRYNKQIILQKPSGLAAFKLTRDNSSPRNIATRNDFIVTGLPRSGTSLLCNLLHQSPNTVVINEPQEVFPALAEDGSCAELDLYYRKLRADIISGIPVKNKVDENGRVVEDTTTRNQHSGYQPVITKPDFVLGTKNPLAYLTRLRNLCDARPDLPKIVMIRHPVDVLNSWERSFPHLKAIDLSVIPFASQSDSLLDPFQKRQLSLIAQEQHLPTRRALYFNYLAALIHRDKDRITVVRYEDLITNPKKVLASITHAIGAEPVAASALRAVKPGNKRTNEDKNHNHEAVELLCQEFLQTWQYN